MTETLSIQVARKYGYGRGGGSRSERFRQWIQNYADSLNLDSLYFKPIEVWDYTGPSRNSNWLPSVNFTNEILEYIVDYDKLNYSNTILNPNFIYKLKGGVYYIPIQSPFDSLTSSSTINNMRGIYIYPNAGRLLGHHTYTTNGFNLDSPDRSIIGIAPFPIAIKFMNWQQNPLNFKPTNQHPSSLKEQYVETANWLIKNFKGD